MCSSAPAKGQSSARRAPEAGNRLQIRLQGDTTGALAAPAQPLHSLPAAGQQPLVPRIAAFSSDEPEPEPGGGGDMTLVDVDMEEI